MKPFGRPLNERELFLSSANSINWGRVLPQVVYYISAYCDLVKAGRDRHGPEDQLLRAHRQLRRYSGGLLCQDAWACR